MKRKITLQDIGSRLGLSTTTVSLALRDHPRISEATKERVRKLMAEMNYAPDLVARALVVGRSNLVGVIVPNSSDQYYAKVIKGIEDAARAKDFHVLLSNGSYDLDSYARHVQEMLALRIGGIIAAPPFTSERPKMPPLWQGLRETGTALVLVNRQLNPPIFHQVTADYNSGVRMVAEALASMGHRRVAYLSGHPAVLPIRQRLAAFKRLARRHRFDEDPELFETSELTYAGGFEACGRLWAALRRKPTAVVAFSDTVAVGVLRFLHTQGVRVPEHVSVVGFDGTAASEFTTPSLSTVSTPMYEVGQQAFDLLMGAMRGDYQVPQSLSLPVRLLLRESVGAVLPAARTA